MSQPADELIGLPAEADARARAPSQDVAGSAGGPSSVTRRTVLYGAGTSIAAFFLDACGGGSGATAAGVGDPSITTASPLPNGTAGAAYSYTMAAAGGAAPYSWSLASATGANSWSVSSAGVVTGTPGSAETDSLTIKVSDSASNSRTGTFSLTVNSSSAGQPTITTASPLPNGTTGSKYSYTMAASGGVAPYSWSLVSASGSNAWTVSSAGVVTGTPGTAETDAITIKVTDAASNSQTGTFPLTVNSGGAGLPAITTASPLPNGTSGSAYSNTMAASGGIAPYSWSLVSATGTNSWAVSSAGVVTGTPGTAETDTLTIKVTDAASSSQTGTFQLTVNSGGAGLPTITTASPLPNGTSGSHYSYTMAASGGVAPYSWSLVSKTGTNTWAVSSAGVVTGTPGTAEADTLTIKVTDAAASSRTGTFALNVSSGGGIGPVAHGQEISASNTGRAGAAAAGVPGYSPTLTTVSGPQTYSTTQTVRNVLFTGEVTVIGGTVTFEFCSFTAQPGDASVGRSSILQIYNGGAATGNVIVNWCDIDNGLRDAQGNFETVCFQAGERGLGSTNPPTNSGSFLLYRTKLYGCGNNVGLHRWDTSTMSYIRECHLQYATYGGGSHTDGIEIYSCGNVTIERCRVILLTTGAGRPDQSCINITTDFGNALGNPIIIQSNYFNGGSSPILTRWFNQDSGTFIKNVRYIGNYFGDSSYYGRECDFNSMNVTFSLAYQTGTDPTCVYWANGTEDPANVWAPNGEGVANPATAPSGDVPAGLPHTPGAFVSQSNFYGGEVWIWNGKIVP